MRREQLEHVLRAAGAITQCRDFVVIGSQAILGEHPHAPDELLVSREVDLYPLDVPALADLIDGTIGEGSPFDTTHGYYGQGVGPETAILPAGWQQRVIRVSTPATGGAVGFCIETHDLAISKYAAGRPKDRAFNRALVVHGLVERETLLSRCAGLTDRALAERIVAAINGDWSSIAPA
ncbi:hypothetical protein L6V77_03745 [Myxococcota bacterium]|nr:hypothetical protein [Myxococcota bacterium]